jgi:hypothetical protein
MPVAIIPTAPLIMSDIPEIKSGPSDSASKSCDDRARATPGSEQHRSYDGYTRRAEKPDPRSLHTKFHLFERVSVDCPWLAWHDLNTGRVELQL